MRIDTVRFEVNVPKELQEFRIKHYKDVFGSKWEEFFKDNQRFELGEEMLVLKDLNKVVGGCIFRKDEYHVRFRDFAILPGNRGKGYAKKLMKTLDDIAFEWHNFNMYNKSKPNDIDMMFLKSVIYLDAKGDEPAFEFGQFLKKVDFKPYVYNKYELSRIESIAESIYKEKYPEVPLKVFKKTLVDNGVSLKKESQKELLKLDKRQWGIVMDGLNWKLSNYGKTGEVSYKYDICPICEDVGSTIQNSDNCKQCYIHITCQEPFRSIGFFKEDYEVSHAYFSAMKDFMMKNKP